jgi:hypothetical protein
MVCANPTALENKIPVAIATAMRRFIEKNLSVWEINRKNKDRKLQQETLFHEKELSGLNLN